MAKKSHYVVWVGKTPGIYTSWPQAETQIKGVSGARFKGFTSQQEAEAAFRQGPDAPASAPAPTNGLSRTRHAGLPTGTYLTVDAAFSGKTRILEWRGVLVAGSIQTEVFRSAPYQGGSANVGEFLAIIQGLRYLTQEGLDIPLYSDSYNAQKWVRDGAHRSGVWACDTLVERLDDANGFLRNGGYDALKNRIPLRDWKTGQWGEIAADFGRK